MEYGNFNLEIPKPVLYGIDENMIVYFYKNIFVLIANDDLGYFIADVSHQIFSFIETGNFEMFNQDSLIEKKELIEIGKDTLLEDKESFLPKRIEKYALILEENQLAKQDNIQSINECKKANLI